MSPCKDCKTNDCLKCLYFAQQVQEEREIEQGNEYYSEITKRANRR